MCFLWLDDAPDLIQQWTNKIVVGFFYHWPFQYRSTRRWGKLGSAWTVDCPRRIEVQREGGKWKRQGKKQGIRNQKNNSKLPRLEWAAPSSWHGNVVYSESLEALGGVRDFAGAHNFMATIYSLKHFFVPFTKFDQPNTGIILSLLIQSANTQQIWYIQKLAKWREKKRKKKRSMRLAAAPSVPQSAPQMTALELWRRFPGLYSAADNPRVQFTFQLRKSQWTKWQQKQAYLQFNRSHIWFFPFF